MASYPRGIRLRDLVPLLAAVPAPDEAFADDMDAVLDSIGAIPEDPWRPS